MKLDDDSADVLQWLRAHYFLQSKYSIGKKAFFDIFKLKNQDIRQTLLEIQNNSLLDNIFAADEILHNDIEQNKLLNISIICYNNVLYPQMLKQIQDPPLVLFAKGNLELLAKTKVAIVGSRSPTLSAAHTSSYLAKKLSEDGFCVVSGFARGIDSAACVAAMQYGTIQIVATGLDVVYPNENSKLFSEVLQNNGLFLSEYKAGENCSRWINVKNNKGTQKLNFTNFPERNRIISGICIATVITQATIKNEEHYKKKGIDFLIGSKSGTLNTAYNVILQANNRQLFAITGSPIDESSMACNIMVARGFAKPIFDIDSFLKSLKQI